MPRGPVGAPRGPVPATVATLAVDVYAGTPRSAPSSRRAPLRQGRLPLGHQGDLPFSRGISTVLTANKYRSRDEQVPFSRKLAEACGGERGREEGARGAGGG